MAAPQNLAVPEELRFSTRRFCPVYRSDWNCNRPSTGTTAERMASRRRTEPFRDPSESSLKKWNSSPPVPGKPTRKRSAKCRPTLRSAAHLRFVWSRKCCKWPWPAGQRAARRSIDPADIPNLTDFAREDSGRHGYFRTACFSIRPGSFQRARSSS